MRVAACLPYRPRDEDRPLNLAVTRVPYDALGWPVYLGDHDGDPFSRALAINVACTTALRDCNPDVLFVADSDILVPSTGQLDLAAQTAYAHDCYAIAYSRLLCLDREGTELMRAGHPQPGREHIIEVLALIWGGAFAISKTLWDATGGFDPRFKGYGSEDLGFLPVANTLGGDQPDSKKRIDGEAWHLAHPESTECDHYGENVSLASRYRACDGDRAAMLKLLAERAVG